MLSFCLLSILTSFILPLRHGTTTHLRIIYCEEAIAMNHIVLSLWIKYIYTLCLQGKHGRDVFTIQLLTDLHLLFSSHFSCSQSGPAQIITSQGSKGFFCLPFILSLLCLPVAKAGWPWLVGSLEQRVQLASACRRMLSWLTLTESQKKSGWMGSLEVA